MIYGNMLLHNIEEVRKIEGLDGVVLQRIPEDVRLKLRPGAQKQYLKAAGAEIRFVMEKDSIDVTLSCIEGKGRAFVYFGDFQHQDHVVGLKQLKINITVPDFIKKAPKHLPGYTFSPIVVRIVFNGAQIHLHDIEDKNIRPPFKEELPSVRMMSYGTSITQGAGASSPMLSYIKYAARRLNIDDINMGTGGSAFCEKELADYLSSRKDWDFATISISVNMLNQGVTAEEFYKSAKYFIQKIAMENPVKKIFCISIYPYFLDIGLIYPDHNIKSTTKEYREILKRIVSELDFKNLFYIDGREILTDFNGLSSDLIHPGDYGMINMGENLYKKLKDEIR